MLAEKDPERSKFICSIKTREENVLFLEGALSGTELQGD